MSGFHDMVAHDVAHTFLDLHAFAEQHTLVRSGEVFEDVSMVLNKRKHQPWVVRQDNHAQGLFTVQWALHCRKQDIGNTLPEAGEVVKIFDHGNTGYFRTFRAQSASDETGLLHIILEAVDE